MKKIILIHFVILMESFFYSNIQHLLIFDKMLLACNMLLKHSNWLLYWFKKYNFKHLKFFNTFCPLLKETVTPPNPL